MKRAKHQRAAPFGVFFGVTIIGCLAVKFCLKRTTVKADITPERFTSGTPFQAAVSGRDVKTVAGTTQICAQDSGQGSA
jgi:hypothetical protein